MEQLLAHMVGDYVLQTDRQAQQKAKSWFYALTHATTYTLPFLFLTQSPVALVVILTTHALIDHYRLAQYPIRWKNLLDNREGYKAGIFNTPTGFPDASPPWLATWLFIIVDNTMHLLINYAAIRWL